METQSKIKPATTRGFSMVKIAPLDDAFSEHFELEVSPVEGQSLQQKEKKMRKGKVEKNSKNRKGKNFDFCTCPSRNIIKRDESSKKGKLSCCKCIFDQIKANLAETQPKNHQNVQKTHFLQKGPGVNGLIGHS